MQKKKEEEKQGKKTSLIFNKLIPYQTMSS
jgi:hypothetical protein